jgi:hypothetical protein
MAAPLARESISPPAPWLWPAYLAFLTLTLALVPPSIFRKSFFVAGHAVFLRYALQHSYQNFSDDYPFMSGPLPSLACFIAFVLCGKPEKELWKLSERGKKIRSLWHPLPRAFAVFTNVRGVGWSHQARHLRFRNDSAP